MNLRPYQTDACARVAELWATGRRRILLVSPTGSGKTTVATAVMRAAASQGHRILFLVHRRELVLQARDTLARYGIPSGVVLAGATPSPWESIQVASIQTLSRRQLPDAQLIVVDEAHHYLESNAYGRLCSQYPGACVLGLTATPWRLDGKGIAHLWDEYVLVATPSELRDQGHLVPVTGHLFRPVDTTGVRVSGGDFREQDLARVALSREILGDVVGEWVARANRVRTILFACGVEHSKRFVAEFVAAGVPAEHVDGTTPKAERDAIITRVRHGETLVLSNCAVATEGFDLPDLACVVLARPTQSSALYLQMVGRVLRPAPGKLYARIHDHAGNVERHGEPYAERDYDPAVDRRREQKLTPRLPRCPQCDAITSDNPCPECGHTKERAQVVVNPEAEAVALESIAPQNDLSNRHGAVTFSRKGETVTGLFVGRESINGLYGPTERLTFEGASGGEFYIDAPADLRRKCESLSSGAKVRMTYVDDVPLDGGKYMKRFRVGVKQ